MLPLLSGNYHKGTELMAKSGCIGAVAYHNMRELYRNLANYSDAKTFLGVPVSCSQKSVTGRLEDVARAVCEAI